MNKEHGKVANPGSRFFIAAFVFLVLLVGNFNIAGLRTAVVSAQCPDGDADADPCKEPKAKSSPSPTPKPRPAATPTADTASQTVTLYYFREATKIATLLKEIASQTDPESLLSGLVITTPAENEIILYGPKSKRDYARRIIATLDLPRPGIKMEMWGIQISSPKSEQMTKVMPRVRAEINRTQQAVRDTYDELQRLTRELIRDDDMDGDFKFLLEDKLFYRSALHANRPLSVPDILLRIAAADDPPLAAQRIAERLDAWLRTSRYRDYLDDCGRLPGANSEPFERFFRSRGVHYERGQWSTDSYAKQTAIQGRVPILEFALHYGRLIHEPQKFSPYFLQQSAEILNSRLQEVIDAMNLDIQDLFIAPTLMRIGKIVHEYPDVEYAQVGKTTVASLSGVQTNVTSSSVSAFDVTPPLRLSDLLKKADELSTSTQKFVPNPTQNLVGAMPLAQVVGLLAAFGEERSVWRELDAGITLQITPNVLRNMTSAELNVDLKIGDPQGASTEAGVRPLSRVSKHELKTTVYVNALDFFDLSAFVSQSTLGGGRGYVPIIGPVWQGLFGEIPVAGKLFSWRRENKTVYHDSLVLTNSFITPTVMGIAVLYPTELTTKHGLPIHYAESNEFECQWKAIQDYKKKLGLE